jgi:hypothetical protein
MIIYGWGNNFKNFEVPNTNQYITITYKYFHIWWLLRITTNRQFFLTKTTQTETGEVTNTSQPITKDEIKSLIGSDIIKPWWFLFNQSLLIALLALVLFMSISRVISPTSKTKESVNTLNTKGELISLNKTSDESMARLNKMVEINKKNNGYVAKLKQNILDKKFELHNKETLYKDNKQQFLSCVGRAEISETSFNKAFESYIKPDYFVYNPNQLIQENLDNEVGLSFNINNQKCDVFMAIDKNITDKVKVNSITLKLN